MTLSSLARERLARRPGRPSGYDRFVPAPLRLHRTIAVRVGAVQVGGGAPVVVQSMTMTDTADAAATAQQCVELAEAGSDMVRITVNTPEAAPGGSGDQAANAGCRLPAPLIGDFHYNGHLLLTRFPDAARALDKYRINPGNVGTGKRRDEQFATICQVAVDHQKPVRIGVNGGSLNQELVMARMQENTDQTPRAVVRGDHQRVHGAVGAAVHGARARKRRCAPNQIIISCKVSRPRDLIAVYRDLARKTTQPLHLGLTEAGMGIKGIAWSASALAILLNEGIGDTIRVSLTPRPGGDRREEVYAACEILQALGLRSFSPAITACPGCGRTTSSTFQELAERVQDYVRDDDAVVEDDVIPASKTMIGGGDGVRRQRPGRIEGRQHRHLAAGDGRVAQLPGLHRRPARHDAARHV